MLLKAGARLEYQNKEGFTPLMIAAMESANPTVISTLLAAGADVTVKTREGVSVLKASGKKDTQR